MQGDKEKEGTVAGIVVKWIIGLNSVLKSDIASDILAQIICSLSLLYVPLFFI